MGVPVLAPPFLDVRTITGGAESVREGLDPMISNPGDPLNRPLNYPRIWQLLYDAGLSSRHAVPFGIAVGAAFLLSLFAFTGRLRKVTAVVLAAALCSPAVMFGLERGNTDLLMFAIVAAGLWFFPRSPWAFLATVIAAFLLKLYPIAAAAPLLLLDRKLGLKLAAVAAIVVVLYIVLTWDDIQFILSNTPRSTDYSFGVEVLWRSLPDRNAGLREIISYLTYPAAAVLVIAGYYIARSTRLDSGSGDYLAAYYAGAAVYIVVFLFGTNWDYRLVFLLFTIPQLVEWIKTASNRICWISYGTLVFILAVLWKSMLFQWLLQLPYGSFLQLLANEATGWLVFSGLLILLLASFLAKSRPQISA